MSRINNPEAYYAAVVRNLDKNEYRANDNYFKHIDSVGDETDIRRKINNEIGNKKPDAYSIDSCLCESSLENWLSLLENQRLHKALRNLSATDVEFIFALSRFEYNCKKFADANGLSKQAISKRFRRLKKIIKQFLEKGCPK